MENVVPQKLCRCFLAICLLSFFSPLPPPRVTVVYIVVCPAEKRRKERENLCISLSTQQFLQQQPLEKMAKKEIPIQRIELCLL